MRYRKNTPFYIVFFSNFPDRLLIFDAFFANESLELARDRVFELDFLTFVVGFLFFLVPSLVEPEAVTWRLGDCLRLPEANLNEPVSPVPVRQTLI